MKRFLLICQSQDGSYVNLVNEALQQNMCALTVFTGKTADIVDGVAVVSAPKYDSTSFISRFKTWSAYVRAAKRYLKTHLDEFDGVMFTSNPPINQGLVRYVQRKRKKCVYLVWDIYPDVIAKSFGKKAAPVTALWRRRNHRIYRRCDAVLTIGEVLKENLLCSYPDVDIRVIPYHTDTAFIHPIPAKENQFTAQYPTISNKKVFMYSGKMGFGHGFDEMLTVAEELKDCDDILFLFVGHGAAYQSIEQRIADRGLTNTMILPYQPLEMLPHSLGCADVSFITIKEQTDGLFLPSKVYDAMASGSAIICISGGQNDVARLMEQGIGESVRTGDAEALKAAVLKLAEDETYLRACQKTARELAVKDYDIHSVTDQYTTLFREVLEA